MKNLALHKFMTLVAALAIGSTSLATDALARGSGGAGFTGGGFAGGHMGGFPAARMGGDVHAGQSGRRGLRDGHEFRNGTPLIYGNDADNAHGFNCWKTQDVPTNVAWRQRQATEGICY